MSVHAPLSFGKRYVVHEELGHGGMGVLFKATDRLTGSVVALKSLTSAAASVSRQELAILLAHQFQILSGLRHPYIVSVLDYGFDARGDPYYAMEPLEDAQDILAGGAREIDLRQTRIPGHARQDSRGDCRPDLARAARGSAPTHRARD
jgi:hypothetical protein